MNDAVLPLDPAEDAAALDVVGDEVPAFSLALLRASPDCVKLLTPEGRISFMSVNGMCAMRIPSFDNVRGAVWWDLWPEDERPKLQDALAAASAGQVARFRGACPTALGEPRVWDIVVTPIDGPEGAPTSILAISREVEGAAAIAA